MKKTIFILSSILAICLAAVLVLLFPKEDEIESRQISDLSIYDIDWDKYSLMAEKVTWMYFSDPPYFEDERVDARGHLTPLLAFFSQNFDLIRDYRVLNDMDIILEFENVLENETFLLNNVDADGSFTLHFYFDQSLANEFFDLINEARRGRLVELNPSLGYEDVSMLEVDFQNLASDYEQYIYGITLFRAVEFEDNEITNSVSEFTGILERIFFASGYDDISLILQFLETHMALFSDVETEEFKYPGAIHFKRLDEDDPTTTGIFYMNEFLLNTLLDSIGYGEWVTARDRWR